MKNLAILVSGGGTTAEAVIKAIQNNELTGLQPFVISSNKDAKANERAKGLGITPYIIDKNTYADQKAFEDKLLSLLGELQIAIISLLGWLPLVPTTVVQKFKGNIMNQHPGPIDPGRPDFGGKGMTNPYRVTAARLAYIWTSGDEAFTESDVHLADEQFDMGDIIRIEKMSVTAKKQKVTIEALRKDPEELIKTTHQVVEQLYPIEYKNVIGALQMFSYGSAKGFKRKTPLIPEKFIPFVEPAKQLAVELFPYKNL